MAGEPMLAHKAMHESEIAAEALLGTATAIAPRQRHVVHSVDKAVRQAQGRGIPPSMSYPADEFPLKMLLYSSSLRLNGARNVSLLVPALPPSFRRRGEAQEHAPLRGRTQAQYFKRSFTQQ
jgi:hypothetical protein